MTPSLRLTFDADWDTVLRLFSLFNLHTQDTILEGGLDLVWLKLGGESKGSSEIAHHPFL